MKEGTYLLKNLGSWYQMMDLCLPSCGFGDELWKLHGLKVEQDPPKSDGDLEGAWEVGFESGEANSTWKVTV